MNKALQKAFQTLKNEARGGAPREAWIADTREVLLMQARNSTNAGVQRSTLSQARHFLHIFFPSHTLALAGRAIGVFTLVAGTILGGGLASAQVYRDSLPGDTLYGVKLAVEKTQIALSPSQDYRTRLHTEFADRRLEEVASLVERSAPPEHLAIALDAFKVELRALGIGLDALRSGNADVVIDVAKLLERKAATYQGTLRKLNRDAALAARASLSDARDLADNLTVKAVAVIVEKHIEGNAAASASIVASKIQDRLVQAEVKLDSVNEQEAGSATVTKARAAIAEAKQLIKDEEYRAALDKIVEVAELTKVVEGEETAAAEAQAGDVTPKPDTTVVPSKETDPKTPAPDEKQGSTGASSTEDVAAGSGSR